MSLKFLSASVVQSAADAFTTTSVATGLAGLNQGYRVLGFEFSIPFAVETDMSVEYEWARRTPTAMLGLSDRRSLIYQKRHLLLTTSGLVTYDQIQRIWVPEDWNLLIVEDPIYLSVDSTGTSAANTLVARIYYEEVRMTDLAKLAALQESTNA